MVTTRLFRVRHAAMAALAAVTLAACSADSGVSVGESQGLAEPDSTGTESTDPTTTDDPSTSDPPTTEEEPPDTVADPPSSTEPPRSADDLLVGVENKPDRPHDELVERAVADIDHWWSQIYPEVYGGTYETLQGGVNPNYRGRQAPITGCFGLPPDEPIPYEELVQVPAYYCTEGDYIAYDESEGGFLMSLAVELDSDSVFPVVIAHEWAHAIQFRNGELTSEIPTIRTEQQADCFAGAWVARAVDGEAGGISFTEADVQVSMSAMIAVRDPIGLDQLEPGGHGTGFDRVNAFQVGYLNGAERCTELLDDPLELMPNTFLSPSSNPEGNADWGYGNTEILGFLPDDMNDFWQDYFGGSGDEGFPALELVAVDSEDEINCPDDSADVTIIAVYCPSTEEVFFDESSARQIYDQFGDFTMGYVFGHVWSEVAQRLWDSPLEGKERALLNDCLAGAYAADVVPDESGQTQRSDVHIEPGDLDEAIQTAIWLSDSDSGDNEHGTAFEKVDHYRDGVLNGVEACNDRIQSEGD